jgi:hypothetical protein
MVDRRIGVIVLFIAVAIFLVACSSRRGNEPDARETSTAVPADENREQETPTETSDETRSGETCTDIDTGDGMSYQEALNIAEDSQCTVEGQLKSNHFCNENTGTWWIDLEANLPGCNPACVVDVNTGAAEINWRCTGALPPQGTGESQPEQ